MSDKPKTKTERVLKSVTFTQQLTVFGMTTTRLAENMENLASLVWDGEKVIATSKHHVHSGQEVWILPAAIASLGWL